MARFGRRLFRIFWLTVAAALLGARVAAAEGIPAFGSPYLSPQPLENFLVFTAPPRPNVPDGQVHWVDAEVPGIDIRGPDGILRNMCPEDGLAWTLAEGDVVGGGGQFVAVECQGQAEGWQMLAFHLCEIQIQASISSSQRQYTRVPPGAPLARECSHTHLSLGYYAPVEAKREIGCPQWYVQGRYWANPACLAQSRYLPAILPNYLAYEDDWELRWLRPELLEPLRRWAVPAVVIGLMLYGLWAFTRPRPERGAPNPGGVALVKIGIWLALLVMMMLASAGPVWPVGAQAYGAYTAADQPYQAMAAEVGYQDWQLLKAFYQVAVPRDARGRPVAAGAEGKVFPPEAAAAIPFGETNAEAWALIDPTQPGPYGQFRAWDAVAERWPPTTYERWVLGRTVSRTAERQREGLLRIAAHPSMLALGVRLGKPLRAEDLYGSSAGAIGRTQVLPEHFAAGGLCDEAASVDVWNDPLAVAECTTRYLTTSGCWGSWYANGDVWSALCGYNPGAWDVGEHQWYWNVLQDRMTRLASAAAQYRIGAAASGAPASPDPLAATTALTATAPLTATEAATDLALAPGPLGGERLVPTPALGLMVTQALLQNGQGAQALPGPLADLVAAAAPQWQRPEQRAVVRGAYRVFRAWLIIFYTPEELLGLGVRL